MINVVAKKIRLYRLFRGLTQQNVADELKISQNAFSKIALGYSEVTFTRLSELAKILQVPITYLVTEGTDLNMDKVTIVITKESAVTTVELDGDIFEQTWFPSRSGATGSGSLDGILERNEGLYNVLTGFFQTEAMKQLEFDN